MPFGKCERCKRNYFYDAKWARGDSHYKKGVCHDCYSGYSPEQWGRGSGQPSKFDTSPYKPGFFAAVAKQQAPYDPIYRRVRVRDIYPDGTITTFEGDIFHNGEIRNNSGVYVLRPMTDAIEEGLFRKELVDEVKKLWPVYKDDLSVESLVKILDGIHEAIK